MPDKRILVRPLRAGVHKTCQEGATACCLQREYQAETDLRRLKILFSKMLIFFTKPKSDHAIQTALLI